MTMRSAIGYLSRVLCLMVLITGWAVAQSASPSEADVHRRAQELLGKMTVEEKTGQLNQVSGLATAKSSIQKLAESIKNGQVGSVLWVYDVKEINRLQHLAVEKSRLHIPLLVGYDVIHGYRATFPIPLAMASSWDPSVEEQAQRVAREDSRAAGINWVFTPMVDIVRDARWGRISESAGEDPYLGSAMARAQVLGLQGKSLGPDTVLACVKHFAGYAASQGGRDLDSSDIPESLLRNVYLVPFHAAEQAGVGSFMSAYIDLNDVPTSGNPWLLNHVLRQEWGFRGFVVSDAWAVGDLVTHGYARDREDAAYKALIAGQNMDMDSHTFTPNVPNLVAAGKITEAQLDTAVLPILETKLRLGLFENAYVDESKVDAVLDRPSSRELSRKIAARSMVLLRNEGNTLPLSANVKKVAVIGPLGDAHEDMKGSWSFEWLNGAAPKGHTVSVVEGLQNKLGANAQIETVAGPDLPHQHIDEIPGSGTTMPDLSPAEVKEWLDKAVAAANRADVVIAAMGEAPNMNSRATLDFQGIQEQMLEAVSATGKPVILVLVDGRPMDIRWASKHVPAILEAWFPGSEGGNAIADVLFGDVNPGGKLPVSWPHSAGQEPLYYNHNLTSDPEDRPGFTSRYWDLSSKPLYPFGYGLSYSSFTFKNLRLDRKQIKAGETAEVQVKVTNTSQIAGDTVAQIYIHQRAGSASRPVRQLEGFERITLQPGETRLLKFSLGKEELSFWSPESKAWGVEPGIFDVWAGGDSTATLHTELEVLQ
jgi:beta-glucosidase